MTRDELHPVEVLLLLGLLLIEALLAVVRLLLLAPPRQREQPCSLPTPEPPAAAPSPALPVTPAPCLADVAQSLLEIPAVRLRELTGCRRRLAKQRMVEAWLAMPI